MYNNIKNRKEHNRKDTKPMANITNKLHNSNNFLQLPPSYTTNYQHSFLFPENLTFQKPEKQSSFIKQKQQELDSIEVKLQQKKQRISDLNSMLHFTVQSDQENLLESYRSKESKKGSNSTIFMFGKKSQNQSSTFRTKQQPKFLRWPTYNQWNNENKVNKQNIFLKERQQFVKPIFKYNHSFKSRSYFNSPNIIGNNQNTFYLKEMKVMLRKIEQLSNEIIMYSDDIWKNTEIIAKILQSENRCVAYTARQPRQKYDNKTLSTQERYRGQSYDVKKKRFFH